MTPLETTMFDCDHPGCEDLISLSDGHQVVVLEPTTEAQTQYYEKGLGTTPTDLERVLDKLYTTGEATLHHACAQALGLVPTPERGDP